MYLYREVPETNGVQDFETVVGLEFHVDLGW